MVARVVNLTSASVTVHYFRREGRGPNLPANENEGYCARRDDEYLRASRWRGSGAAALGLMRRLAAEHPDHLSRKQREIFESIAAEYDLFVERQRQWVTTMRP